MKNNSDGRGDNSDEEQTYNNLESIQLFMKKNDGEEAASDIEKSIEDEEDYITPEPEPVKKKKIVKKMKEESYIESEEDDYDEEEDEDFDEDSESEKFTMKKRGRDKKGGRKDKKKKKVRNAFIDVEAYSDDDEESDNSQAEITNKQQKELFKKYTSMRDNNNFKRKRPLFDQVYDIINIETNRSLLKDMRI
jgi:hypothetical protein